MKTFLNALYKNTLGFLLNIIASICIQAFTIIAFPISFVLTWWNRDLGYAINKLNAQQENIAIAKDITLNTMLAPLLNSILLTKDAIKFFGDPEDTISYVLGYNLAYTSNKFTNQYLTPSGWWWIRWLDRKEKNHCLKAFNRKQGKKF